MSSYQNSNFNGRPKTLGEILSSYFNFFDEDAERDPAKEKYVPKKPEEPFLLQALKPVPWILALMFAFSFVWDFNEVQFTAGTYVLNAEGLMRIVTVSGLIGFFTNRIAILMLFRPVEKRPLLGIGLIPAHKDRIAKRLSIAVSEDLINPHLIRQKLDESDAIQKYRSQTAESVKNVLNRQTFRNDLKQWANHTLSDMIANPGFRRHLASEIAREVEQTVANSNFDKAALKAYTFFRGRQIEDLVEESLMQLPDKISKELNAIDHYLDQLPDLIDESSSAIDQIATRLIYKLIQQLDVQHLVEENLNAIDEKKLEAMIWGATNEQLRIIQYLGAVLGLIGGFVIWEPVISLGFIIILFGVIYGADRLIGKS